MSRLGFRRFWPWVVLILVTGFAHAARAQDGAAGERGLSPGTGPKHGIAMHGEPALPPDFKHLDYANPDAPKGGKLVMGIVSTFDNLNSFIVLGTHVWPTRFYTQETLMFRSANEPFTLYGLLAETVEAPEDRSWVTFKLREEARFSDGTPVTADDLIYSAELLKTKGRPNWRGRFERVASIDKLGPRTVRFVFEKDNTDRELAMLIGLMPVFSKAYYTEHEFDETSLDPPLTSGPYLVTKVDAGRSITFTRNPDYWGKDLPVNRGLHNFDEIRLDYYRDANAAFEAFKAGEIHLRLEEDEAQWEKSYNFEAVSEGHVKRQELRHSRPSGMKAFVFNTRREKFQDRKVREALTLLFDFEWVNRNFFYSTYERTRSYFDNSELAAIGPASEKEREFLKPYPDAVTPEIMAKGWVPPETGGPRAMRPNLRRALTLFRDAGYGIINGRMINRDTGKPFGFEILLRDPNMERVALSYKSIAKRLGIDVSVRTVDSAQFEERSRTRQFDVKYVHWTGSLSPGNEQYFRYGSRSADNPGTYNFAGIKSEAVDAMIGHLLEARTREDLVAAARALDRVLLSGFYVIPLYHIPVDRIAYWSSVHHPEKQPLIGYKWWIYIKPDVWWWEEPKVSESAAMGE